MAETNLGRPGEPSVMSERANEIVSATIEKSKEMASSLVQTVENVASNLGQKAEKARETVAGEMKNLAGTIRTSGPRAGVLGTAASGAAGTLEAGGKYLQDHDLNGIAKDVTDLIRRHPVQAIVLGLGVGFLVGRASRR